jgi:hypothetical protein
VLKLLSQKAEVRPVPELNHGGKEVTHWGVFVGSAEIGRTKLQCDAQMAMHAINDAISENVTSAEVEAYANGLEDGYQKAIRDVAEGYDDSWV